MNPHWKLDLDISIVIFWRYFWRMALFTLFGAVVLNEATHWWLSHHHYTKAQALMTVHIGTLIFLFLLLFYGIGIWAGKLITRPLKIRGETIQVNVVHKNGQPVSTLHKALSCWWGFNWRNSLLFVLLAMLISSFSSNAMALGILYLPMMFAIGIFSMWWWIFHPIGGVHLILQKEPFA